MANEMRDRLIPIVKDSLIKHIGKSCNLAENIVDDLLSENVTIPPVAFSNEFRKRMVGLLNGFYEESGVGIVHYFTDEESEMLADYILADGWIRLPCKVGDKTFLLLEKIKGDYDIVESKCVRITDNGYGKYYSMSIDCKEIGNTLECGISDFGKWVFLTKEEAEQKLKEMRGGNADTT